MNIILEGPDGTGKSTFARVIERSINKTLLSPRSKVNVIEGEGPEKFPGEIDARVTRYLQVEAAHPDQLIVFDRHPCISQSIYGELGNGSQINSDLMELFYRNEYFIIYCQGTPQSLSRHKADQDCDDEDYLKKLKENYYSICEKYDLWAIEQADLIVRNFEFDNVARIIRSIV